MCFLWIIENVLKSTTLNWAYVSETRIHNTLVMTIWKVWNFKLKNYDSLDMIGWLGLKLWLRLGLRRKFFELWSKYLWYIRISNSQNDNSKWESCECLPLISTLSLHVKMCLHIIIFTPHFNPFYYLIIKEV